MLNVYLQGPRWFFGVAASLEGFAALIALAVALVAFKIYRISEDRKYLPFAGSFVLLTLSFLSRAVTDALLQEFIVKVPAGLESTIFLYGYLAHILLALVAYLILVIVTYKISDKHIMALLFVMLAPSLILSGSYFHSFYVLSFIFLSFITLAYLQNWRMVRSIASGLVFFAFLFITLAQACFLLERLHDMWYIAANALQGLGYLLIVFALLKVLVSSLLYQNPALSRRRAKK